MVLCFSANANANCANNEYLDNGVCTLCPWGGAAIVGADNIQDCYFDVVFPSTTTEWVVPTTHITWINTVPQDLPTKFYDIFELIDITTGTKLPYDEAAHTYTGINANTKYRFIDMVNGWGAVKSVKGMFTTVPFTSIDLPNTWGNISSTELMFFNAPNLVTIKLPDAWGDSLVYLASMFAHCKSLKNINLPDDWHKVQNLGQLFYNAFAFAGTELPDTWGNVTNASYMFSSCREMETVVLPDDWRSVGAITAMFSSTRKLKTIKLKDENGNIRTDLPPNSLPARWGNIRGTISLFSSAFELEAIAIPDSWDNMINVKNMFSSNYKLTDIKLLDENGNVRTDLPTNSLPVSWGKITNTAYMFYNNRLLSEIIIPDSWGLVQDTSYIFQNVPLTEIDLPVTWDNVWNTRFLLAGTNIDYIVLPDSWENITDFEGMFTNAGFTASGVGVTNETDPNIPVGTIASPAVKIFPSQLYAPELGVGVVVESCQPGYYVFDEVCIPVGPGYYGVGGWTDRASCGTGRTSIGFGAASSHVTDCGRVLNFTLPDGTIKQLGMSYTRTTFPSLVINSGGTEYYGKMKLCNNESDYVGTLRLNYDGNTYCVYDDNL